MLSKNQPENQSSIQLQTQAVQIGEVKKSILIGFWRCWEDLGGMLSSILQELTKA